ncbi:hypothetical protein POM88_049659 [Heracleum sosnowskyi]|uniref:C2H2-type domain-containing protein n=1 Tax=Heracleum sosnowskyi TaxID=360622 RepID=A0AAD8M1W1_9APIA|nr:hypothetical protein POM88_049659 [Heracleum sosnowskyi]
MDTHLHSPTITPSGHENNQGVHVCHKCGWPFPKLHPSSKHRRAHRRICGTIQGYKLSHFNVSDAEQDHPSDEDCKTPSPKIEKRSIAGIGERSYRSEDEVFSDAVAEFSDSGMSPGSEEQLEDVKELEKNVQKTVVDDDIYSIGTLKVDADSDSANPMGSQPADNILPSSGLVESTPSGKDKADMSNLDLSLLSGPVEKTEAIVDAVQIKGYLAQDMIDGSSSNLSEREEKDTTNVQSLSNDLPSVEDADIMLKDAVNQETLKSESSLVLGTVDVKRTHNKDNKDLPEGQSVEPAKTLTGFECARTEHDLSYLSGCAKQEASAGIVLVGVDPTQDNESGAHCDSTEICNTNRENEETMHVLSVASDLPIVNHADLMLQDFKDHRTFKSGFPPMGFENVIRSLEGDNELMVIEESPLKGGASDTSSDMDDVEEDMITIEGPDKGLADSLESSVTTGKTFESEDLEFRLSTSRSTKENIQPNCSLQGVEPYNEASHTESTGNDEISQTAILSDDNKKNNHNVMARAEEVDTEEYKNSERVTRKEISGGANPILVYEGGDQASKLRLNNGGEHVDDTMNFSDEAWIEDNTEKAWIEDRKEAAAVEKFSTPTMTNLEPEQELLSSNYSASVADTPVSSINTSVSATIVPAHPSSGKSSDNDSQEVITEPELNIEKRNVVKFVGDIVDSKFSGSCDLEVEEDNSKRPMREEPETLAIHSNISHECLPDIRTGNEMDDEYDVMQESDVKLTKQAGGASAVKLTVDLSSQIESVEDDWGSVTVHSAQSNQPAARTEVPPETYPEGPESESTKLHPESSSERLDMHKADVFEPPSFMTLVEPKGGSDQKNATSEIETVQTTQQPKTEVLQAGWLPLLSNVINESAGRNKNEEMIAKVTNWSTAKQQSTPLKNLLGEAKVETRTKSPSPRRTETNIQTDATGAKSNVSFATTVKEVLGSEASAGDQTVRGVTAEEWNSPARYPVEIKKEKKKANGKPFWVPFACCSSVN